MIEKNKNSENIPFNVKNITSFDVINILQISHIAEKIKKNTSFEENLEKTKKEIPADIKTILEKYKNFDSDSNFFDYFVKNCTNKDFRNWYDSALENFEEKNGYIYHVEMQFKMKSLVQQYFLTYFSCFCIEPVLDLR